MEAQKKAGAQARQKEIRKLRKPSTVSSDPATGLDAVKQQLADTEQRLAVTEQRLAAVEKERDGCKERLDAAAVEKGRDGHKGRLDAAANAAAARAARGATSQRSDSARLLVAPPSSLVLALLCVLLSIMWRTSFRPKRRSENLRMGDGGSDEALGTDIETMTQCLEDCLGHYEHVLAEGGDGLFMCTTCEEPKPRNGIYSCNLKFWKRTVGYMAGHATKCNAEENSITRMEHLAEHKSKLQSANKDSVHLDMSKEKLKH